MTPKFIKGRAGLILDHPFFGSLALRLNPIEDPSCKTAWVDGTTLGYSPEFIDGLNLDEVKGLICHEVMHCALQHHTRRQDRDIKLWNIACDYVINPLLLASGLALPEGALVNSAYDGLSAEQVYSIISAEPQNGQDSKGIDGMGEGIGEVRDAKAANGGPAGEADMRQVAQNWQVVVAQATQQAKLAGDLPGAFERAVEKILNPKLDWKQIFRRFVDSSSKNDYSWARPNRRWIGRGVYLPAVHSLKLGRVVAVIDTSGSIQQSTLDEFASEINAILQDYQADCKVLYCDSAVTKVDDFGSGETVSLNAVGGGGTDFRPPFEMIDRKGDVPVCLIYFTDGRCDMFPDVPVYPVLWVQTGSYEYFNPPFGEVLKL